MNKEYKESLSSSFDSVKLKYEELILAVGTKFPGETRHETALRYIRDAEMSSLLSAKTNKEEEVDTTSGL